MAKRIVIEIVARTRQFEAGVGRTTQQLNYFQRAVGRVSRTFTAFAALFVARRLGRAIAESVQQFAEFEKGIANIGILLDEEIGRLDEWNQTIKEVAISLGVATDDLLKAGFDIQSAVGDVSHSLDIFQAASKGAVAGGSDVASTAKGLVTMMEHYADSLGSAAYAMDVLMKTQKFARANIGELSSEVGRFLPVASEMNIQIEEVMAVYAQLTRALGDTSEASTALRMMLQKLLVPTTTMTKFSKKLWGMTAREAVETYGLIKTLKGLTTVEKELTGKMWSRVRAIIGVTALTEDLSTEIRMANAITESAGETNAKLAIQLETTERILARFRETAKEFGRTIGEEFAPAVETGAFALTEFMRFLKALLEFMEVTKVKEFSNVMSKITRIMAGLPDFEQFAYSIGKWANAIENATEAFKRFLSKGEEIVNVPTEIDKAFRETAENIIRGVRTYGEEAGIAFGLQTELLGKQLGLIKEDFPNAWTVLGEIVRQEYVKMEEKAKLFHEKATVEMVKTAKILRDAWTTITNTFVSSWGNAMADMIVEGVKFKDTMKVLWEDMKRAFIKAVAEMIAKLALLHMTPAFEGIFGFFGLKEGGVVPKMQQGGIVRGAGKGDKVPALLEPGELVIPKQQVPNVINNAYSPTVNVSMAGALVMDDPHVVEKLYREHLRDKIKEDIRTKRDIFY